MDNLVQLLDLLWSAIGGAFDWLEAIFTSYGLPLTLILCTVVAVHSLIKFVFSPIFGGGSSDRAKNRKDVS